MVAKKEEGGGKGKLRTTAMIVICQGGFPRLPRSTRGDSRGGGGGCQPSISEGVPPLQLQRFPLRLRAKGIGAPFKSGDPRYGNHALLLAR